MCLQFSTHYLVTDVLDMKKPRQTKFTQIVQGHRASKWQKQDLKLGI